jgi:hypothetical protein
MGAEAMTKKRARAIATIGVMVIAVAFIASSVWQIVVAVFGARQP